MAKTHWLHGKGPNKEVFFKVEIDKETECFRCLHQKVCPVDVVKRCSNYEFGTTEYNGCDSCNHRFTRFDTHESLPCFHCPDFLPKEILNNVEEIEV